MSLPETVCKTSALFLGEGTEASVIFRQVCDPQCVRILTHLDGF